MYIIQVAPLIRLPSTLTAYLSYYHGDFLPRGSIVRVTIRQKDHLGVVISAQNLQESKLHLRKSQDFSLKPIESVFSEEPLISEPQLALAEWMSEYYAYSLGMLLKSFLPRIHSNLKKCPKDISSIQHDSPDGTMSTGIISAPDTSRLSYLQTLVHTRSELKGQTLILVSNLYALTYLSDYFTSQYAADEISIITSSLSTRAFRTEWEHIKEEKRTIIISTRAGIFLPFFHLHTIIVENETSGAYYSFDMYPRYHTVDVAYRLAYIHSSFLVFSDLLPSLKSITYLGKHGVSPPPFPPLPTNHIYRANMSNERDLHTSPVISQYFEHEIHTHATSTPILILSNRRGSSPFIICKACGFRFTCSHCDSLLVEHTFHIDRYTIQNIFVCHKCTQKFKPKSECPECNSTDIRYAGAGTEKLASYIRDTYPHLSVGILDTDYTPDYADQLDLFQRWQAGEVHILIATQMIEKFFTTPLQTAPLSLIRESDMMLRFPQYSAKETGIQLFSRIITQSTRTYLQYWDISVPEEDQTSPLDQLQASKIHELYADEQTERQQFQYPPYKELVAIHSTHRNKAKAWDQARRTKRVLKDISLSTLGPVEHIHSGGRFQVSLLLRLDPHESPAIKRRLLGLIERGQQIDIDPKDVL